MSNTDQQYLSCDPYADDCEVRLRRAKVVRVKQERNCAMGFLISDPHTIKIGERAVYETAMVDGEWSSCHTCLRCLDLHIAGEI